MHVSPAFLRPLFQQRPDRRNRRRFKYPALVLIDGRPVPGRDISSKGLSVLLAAPRIGDTVQVTLAGATAGAAELVAAARVVRVDTGPEGIVVGLEFLDE